MESPIIQIDPETMGGTPVFHGTRVPIQTFEDYIMGGETVSEFLTDFPTVTHEQIEAYMHQAKQELIERCKPLERTS